MIFWERELLFQGSQERLKRNIAKQGGTFPAPGTFRILWRSAYFKWGLSFRMTGQYEKTEEGFRIKYRFRPSVVTVLWTALPLAYLLNFALWELKDGNVDSAAAVSAFSLMYPVVVVWQYLHCHKKMRRYFEIVTN